MLKSYLILFILFINTSLISFEQASDELNAFFTDFIIKHNINHPLHNEYSIKFTKSSICFNRYLIGIHTCHLEIENKEQIDNLLSFIKSQEIKNEFKEHLKYPGIIGYAADFSGARKRYRAYFLFRTNYQKGIVGYEWFDEEENYNKRTYNKIPDYNDVLTKILSKDTLYAFNNIKEYLILKNNHLRTSQGEPILYFIFKENTTFYLIKDILKKLIETINKSINLDEILNDIIEEKVVWISLGSEEITLYYRNKM